MSQKKLPIFAPFEVIIHNTPDDCWLSFLGKVFDVTFLIQKYRNENCIKPILAFAGKDVSHWFDARTGEIQHYVHPITGVQVPYCPHGMLPDVSYQVPTTQWRPINQPPWWKNDKYQIGVLTKLVRPLRIINMLLSKETIINVCCEDNFYRIKERYSMFNSEADSYTWVYEDELIDMKKTMDENGIPDDREKMAELGIPKSFYTPSVKLYYNDDLKHWEDTSEEEQDKICCECEEKDGKDV